MSSLMKWLRDNNKRVLAFLAVFLMIAFLLPTTFSPGRGANATVGEVRGGEKVTIGDLENAYREWGFLKTTVLAPSNPNAQQPGQQALPQYIPLVAQTLTGNAGAQQIEEHKALYFLLQQEARRLGIRPTPQELDGILDQLRLRLPDGREVAYSDERVRNSNYGAMTRQAVSNLLSVELAFARAMSAIKVSRPQRDARIAMQMQTLTLRYVPFAAADFAAAVPAPTPEQLATQFEKYADTLAGNPTRDNPFGFGYKLPNRVKLQYLTVGRDQLRRAVLENPQIAPTPEGRNHYWQKEAYKYFLNNRDKFAAAAPATTQATTGPLSLGGGSAPTTAPATAEFTDAVRQLAMEELVKPEIDALARKVQGRITSALNAEFANYSKAHAASQPATNTSLGLPYDSFDYLEALANEVQKQFGVLPTVVNLGDKFRTLADLQDVEGLATAYANVGGQPVGLAEYAFGSAAAFLPPDDRDRPSSLELFEPSQVMTDVTGAVVIFRLTAADAAHRPAALAEVAADVERDVRRQLAYDAAHAAAGKLIASGEPLDAAAAAAGKTVSAAADVRLGGAVQLPGLPSLSQAGLSQFTVAAFDLLADDSAATATTRPTGQPTTAPTAPAAGATPRAVIDVKADDVALATELAALRGDLPSELIPLFESQIAQQLTSEFARPAAIAWFSYDNVAQRTGFTGPAGR